MKQRLLWLTLPLTALLVDWASKVWITKTLRLGEQLTVIEGFFYLKLGHNKGAIFGILQDANPWVRGTLFLVAGLAALTYFGWEFLKADTPNSHRIALGLILGGALGNGLDRLLHGYVIDFLDFWFGSWEYWIFNFADSFIVSGAILYGLLAFLENRKQKTEPEIP